MPLDRGLLISSQRNSERSASSEIHFVLSKRLEIEEELFNIRSTRVSGLITVRLDHSLDSHHLIREMIRLESEAPYFMHCLKIRPVDYTLIVDPELLVNDIKAKNIQRDGSFRITVNKRHNPIASMEIIHPVAELFPNNIVDLNSPDWEIWIEIVADQLGYSIIEPDLVFSTDLAFIEEDENITNWFLD